MLLALPFALVVVSPHSTPIRYPKIASEIVHRCDLDQTARKILTDLTDQQKFLQALKRMQAIDRANTAFLYGVVKAIGWPSRAKVGVEAAHDAWLMLQHADLDPAFQKKCLFLILPYMELGEVQRPDVALLIDRVRVSEKKPQVYGSQWKIEKGAFVLSGTLQDPASVDIRRKEMNLQSLTEYKKVLESVYSKMLESSKRKG